MRTKTIAGSMQAAQPVHHESAHSAHLDELVCFWAVFNGTGDFSICQFATGDRRVYALLSMEND